MFSESHTSPQAPECLDQEEKATLDCLTNTDWGLGGSGVGGVGMGWGINCCIGRYAADLYPFRWLGIHSQVNVTRFCTRF